MTIATDSVASFKTDVPTVRETLPLSLARSGEPAPARRLPWRRIISAALAVCLCAAVGVAHPVQTAEHQSKRVLLQKQLLESL